MPHIMFLEFQDQIWCLISCFCNNMGHWCEKNRLSAPNSKGDHSLCWRRASIGVFSKKKPYFCRKSTSAPQTLSSFFAKTSSNFSQINIQANFDYIFFLQTKTCDQWPARMGAPEGLVWLWCSNISHHSNAKPSQVGMEFTRIYIEELCQCCFC